MSLLSVDSAFGNSMSTLQAGKYTLLKTAKECALQLEG
jgi:hypothetical protein